MTITWLHKCAQCVNSKNVFCVTLEVLMSFVIAIHTDMAEVGQHR